MTAAELLATARAVGVELTREPGRVRFRAPAGAVAAFLRAVLRRHRSEILELLPLTSAADVAAVCPPPAEGCNLDAAARDPEVAWRFARMLRRVPAEGPLPALVARPGLLLTPERCSSCGELLAEPGNPGGACGPCTAAAELLRLAHAAGLIVGGRIVLSPPAEGEPPALESGGRAA